jgi:hypothetical protein
MLKRGQFWSLSAIGAACLIVAALNMVMYSGNQGLRSRVSSRQQYIQQSLQLQGLYQQIVRAVADLSVRNHDEQLKAILAKEGINVTVHPQAASSPAPAARPGKPKERP